MSSQDTPSLSKEVLKGTQWYVAMRWSIKGLGFVSSAVLARLLIPEDFGLVAIVMVIFGLISLLFEFGVNWALIQNNKATDDHFHTAWTVRLLQSAVIALLLAAFSPVIANIYDDIRLQTICQILALGTFIRGFENIGTVKFQKDMRFAWDFSYNVAPKIISTFVTIGLAFYFKSYLALVFGTLINNVIVVIASYLFIRFKPKFSLSQISEIWGFSQWILVRNVAQYISSQGDVLLMSALATPAKIGFYKWGTELSYMTVSEVQMPFSRALVPALAKIKDDHDRLIAAYLKALSMMTLFAAPIALGFGAVAHELIPIFLGGGDKWLPVVPIIEALVFSAMGSSMYGVSNSLLLISGHVKYTAYVQWIQAAIALVSIYPAYYIAGIVGVAYSRVFLTMVMFCFISYLAATKCQVPFSRIASVVWRPVISGCAMFFLLTQLSDFILLPGWQLLFLKIAVGALFYTGLVLLLWLVSGKPDTFEKSFLEKIKTRLFAHST